MGKFIVPALLLALVGCGALRGVKLYDAFVEGAWEGLRTAARILPYLLGALVAVEMMKISGAMDVLSALLRTPLKWLGLDSSLSALVVLRPFSGSAALAALQDVFTQTGPDSPAARTACVLMGSTETVVYTISVYFSSQGITKSRHTLPAALISMLAGIVAASLLCRVM